MLGHYNKTHQVKKTVVVFYDSIKDILIMQTHYYSYSLTFKGDVEKFLSAA